MLFKWFLVGLVSAVFVGFLGFFRPNLVDVSVIATLATAPVCLVGAASPKFSRRRRGFMAGYATPFTLLIIFMVAGAFL